jgi:tripartite-type tricarboxylate transporter receptor subunit TctC
VLVVSPKVEAKTLQDLIVGAIQAPDFRKRLDELMLDPGGGTPEEFATYVKAMSERVGGVIRRANVKAE